MSVNETLQEIKISVERIHQRLDDRDELCKLHSITMKETSVDIASLKESREYTKGILKALGIGVPAAISLVWAIIKYKIFESKGH